MDIGGVIIELADGDADTSFFGAHYLRTPVVHEAFDALAALGPAFDEVHLLSTCGEATDRRTASCSGPARRRSPLAPRCCLSYTGWRAGRS
ncbi:hypothetical protein GA0070612_5370 [Micromonospora chokoriensis]|uniref:Uncharacterized protein n=1 Tax=Micromonospora chokoriensis TaxID=356851 RepID=A0A1C4YXH2_9ACTN|nr:hypothetical protein GA0070612_5370 [Micromonospora chokoriensis]